VPPRRRAGDDRHFVDVVVGGLLCWRRVWSGRGVEIQLHYNDDSVTPTLLPSTADLGLDLGRPSASSVTLQNTTHSISGDLMTFLPARRYASAGNRHSNVSVRPSVRLSRAGIVSKRRKLAA